MAIFITFFNRTEIKKGPFWLSLMSGGLRVSSSVAVRAKKKKITQNLDSQNLTCRRRTRTHAHAHTLVWLQYQEPTHTFTYT